MKKLIIFILAGWIQVTGFSQPRYQSVRISEDLELIRISENAYIHVSYAEVPGMGRVSANGLIFISGHEAFLFDTPWDDSLTKELYDWITGPMGLEIAGFVPNHWHKDCLGGLGFLQSRNVESYANRMTIDLAKLNNLPVPGHGFTDSLLLKCGDQQIECYYPGAAHSMDNIVVWIPAEKILFAGCMVKSLDAKNLGNTADGDLDAYPETLEKLIRKFPDAKIVIPGHGLSGGLELILHTIELTRK